MERNEIIKCIDDGANYYLRLLGDARHMEYVDNGIYSIIRPKEGAEGGTSLFHIRLENLPEEKLEETIREVKELNLHTWWGINLSESVQKAVYGDNRPAQATEDNEEEACMALLLEEKPGFKKIPPNIQVKKVSSPEEFKLWAQIANKVLHGGYALIHPENHYHLVQDGIMPCYIGYYQERAAAVCSVIHKENISSLEFVCTEEIYRRQGLAHAVCATAIEEAFRRGSRIITLRACPNAKKLYVSLGFRIY